MNGNWVILGPSGSGKTTFARELGRRLEIPAIEVDSLFWSKEWSPTEPRVLNEKVRRLLDSSFFSGWIVEGHDTKIRELTWARADQVVWLDYSPSLIRFRLVRKTLLDILTRRVLWNGNRESLRHAIFGPESRLHRGLRDAGVRNREYAKHFSESDASFMIHRLRSPREARRWLERVASPAIAKPVFKRTPSSLVELVGGEAALLSISEVGLGSILHGFQVPLGGHLLSLNQGFLLSRALRKAQGQPGARGIPASISGVAAILKSLSPAGKKLTPMLAIGAQGCMFTLGSAVFSATLPGAILGSVLASTWAFLQPFLIYYAFYGDLLAQMGKYFIEKMNEAFHFDPNLVMWVVLAVLAVKASLAAGLAIYAFRGSSKSLEVFEEHLLRAGQRALVSRRCRREVPLVSSRAFENPNWASSVRGAMQDLLQPLFLLSLALTAGFLFFTDSKASLAVWILLRPLAIGFILFFVVRILPVERFVARMERSRFQAFARSLGNAIDTVRRI